VVYKGHGPQQTRCVASTCMFSGACNVVVVWFLCFCRIRCWWWRYAACRRNNFHFDPMQCWMPTIHSKQIPCCLYMIKI
jgi:hypothetical protein